MEQEQLYRRALEWIHSIGRFGMKPGLERISELLERLGNPHRRLKFLHIGGTNGKGSTAAMAASVLQAAGYSIALYTSPYLKSFTNRMAVDGRDISPEALVELAGRVRPLVEEIGADDRLGQMTEFEVVTTLALAYFERRRPDLVVFEVGLGGRLDATNVVTPLAAVITNISLEHTAVLGDTVPAIAREKAGIIKPGVPLLTASADPAALGVIADRCSELQAPLYRVLPPGGCAPPVNCASYNLQQITPEGQLFSYTGFHRRLADLFIPLRGPYQAANAATALAAVELLAGQGFAVEETALRRGLAETNWPGRLEVLGHEPLLIMDGAHNPAAMTQLAAAVPEYFRYRRLILVLGIMADKDMAAMLRPVLPLASAVVITRPDLARAAAPQEIARAVGENTHYDGPVLIEERVGRALDKALDLASPGDAVLVTGSFYTVSEARAQVRGEK